MPVLHVDRAIFLDWRQKIKAEVKERFMEVEETSDKIGIQFVYEDYMGQLFC